MPPKRAAAAKSLKKGGPYKSSKKQREEPETAEDSERPSTPPAPQSPASPSPPPSESADPAPAAAPSAVPAEEEADIAPLTRRKKSKSVSLTEEQEVALAEWMRSHPELYSKGLKAYKDTAKKNRLWDEKAQELDLESGVLLRTWYDSVRTKVGKMTKEKSGSASKELTERDQFIMSNFGFLRDHIARVRGRTACSVSRKQQH